MAITNLVTNYTTVDQGSQIAYGTFQLTGNYGTGVSNGEVFDLTKIYYQGLGLQASPSTPAYLEFDETPVAGTVPTGYIPIWAPGSLLTNGQLVLMNGLAQYTPGSAYSAGLLATTFTFFVTIATV